MQLIDVKYECKFKLAPPASLQVRLVSNLQSILSVNYDICFLPTATTTTTTTTTTTEAAATATATNTTTTTTTATTVF